MKYSMIIILSIGLLVGACDERKTNLSPQERLGTLRISFDDSYSFNDSTGNLAPAINYDVVNSTGMSDRGTFDVPAGSHLGDIHQLVLDQVEKGPLVVRYMVSRPFIIMGRKDDTSAARFSDSTSVYLLGNSSADVGPIDIWAYRLDQLVLHFNPTLDSVQADSIIGNLGAEKLSQRRSVFDNGLMYLISTQGLGLESDLRPVYAQIPGVESVNFSIIGHSFF